jgi:hypothetical protein
MRIPDKITGAFATAKAFNELRDVVQWLARYAIVTVAAPLEAKPLGQGRGLGLAQDAEAETSSFWAKILGFKVYDDTSYYRWQYLFQEVDPPNIHGYGNWVNTPNGRSKTDWIGAVGYAYNTLENMNRFDGMIGNGVDWANLAGSHMRPVPCPVNAIVRMYEHKLDGSSIYWFQYSNSIDGSC